MDCHQVARESAVADAPIILVGNPNVGKSALFACLTGRHVDISNYPGTTVELAFGRIGVNGRELTLVDTPGIQSLPPRSDDERVARDILLQNPPWAVVQVADTKNLRRTLLLTFQLAEYDVPFVLVLNMADEAEALGIQVDHRRLAQILGTAVIPMVAVRGEGLAQLQTALLAPGPAGYRIRFDGVIETAAERLVELMPSAWRGRRGRALALLAGGDLDDAVWPLDATQRARMTAIVEATAAQYDKPLGYITNQQRLRCADCLLAEVWHAPPQRPVSLSERLGEWMIHPLAGWPIMALILTALFLFVGQLGAGVMVDWLEGVLFGQWINPLATRLASFLPGALLRDFLVGEYGLVTMALSYSIAIVLPIVFTFFLAFGLLEDSGYLARLAVMANRPFKAMGLNGKAVLPMVLGLGCDTMATLTTRILETRKERLQVTLLLALGVPCSAQLGVLMGMAAVLSGTAVIIWLVTVLATLLAVGWLAARLIPGQRSDFIVELPPVRRPRVGNIVVKTVARLEWYLKEVLPLFVLGTALLFVLSELGVLIRLERLVSPLVVGFLGLPASTASIFLVGFLRRDFGAAGLFALARSGVLDVDQMIVSLVVVTLFVPCIANVLMIVREHGRRTALAVTAFVFPFAFVVGGALNFLLEQVRQWL